MNKKEWLDYLYYKVGNQQFDFFVCGLKKINEVTKATKWKKYSEVCFPLNTWEDDKIEWVNQRQIFPNELVLDIEERGDLKEITKKLEGLMLGNYAVYETGSRGYHIHIFSLFPVLKEVKEFFIKLFGADIIKAGEKTMIALENTPHWKTGKIKKLIKEYDGRNRFK